MVDTRAARVLAEDRRAMLDAGEERWLREQALDAPGSCDHLLIGTSLPWLLPHLVHDAEAWDAALCRGERGGALGPVRGKRLRRRADLEHWAASPASFAALAGLIAEAGSGPGRPGDGVRAVRRRPPRLHRRAQVAFRTPGTPSRSPDARVLQLTCSPVHNSIPLSIRLGFRFGWSAVGRAIGRRFARHGKCDRPPIDSHKTAALVRQPAHDPDPAPDVRPGCGWNRRGRGRAGAPPGCGRSRSPRSLR